MKKLFSLSALFILIVNAAYSQDIIYKRNGVQIKSKVIEVTSKEVKYKDYSFSESAVFSIAKSEVSQIVYESGLIERFESSATENTSFSKFEQGKTDAHLYYHGSKGANTGTVLCSYFLTPLGGLVCAVICTSVPPKKNNLKAKDETLLNNPDYFRGYQIEAIKIKNGKVWRSFAITSGVVVIGVALIAILVVVSTEEL